jgi:HAMP domain-containing protein
MEPRLIIAYVLMAILAVAAACGAAWLYRNSPSRRLARRRQRDDLARQKRSMELMAKEEHADA